MEELGEKERELHRQVGATLLLECNDLVVMIGEKASWFADGIRETGARDEQMIILEDASSARALVEDFEGSVLIKGARLAIGVVPTQAVSELESEVWQHAELFTVYEAIFGPLRLFQFISVQAILAGITALVIGYILGLK